MKRESSYAIEKLILVNNGFDPATAFNDSLTTVRDFILTDGAYEEAVCPGAAVMYAILALELPQTDIYKDYTHLTEFGRLNAAYAFYTQEVILECINYAFEHPFEVPTKI